MLSTYYHTDALYLHQNGVEMEHDALWKVTVEAYPAEAYSWGQSRGWEHEVSAELVRWSIDRTRADAVKIDGESEVERQESIIADTFDWRVAAEDEAAIWSDQQMDMRRENRAEGI